MPPTASSQPTRPLIYLCPQSVHTRALEQVGISLSCSHTLPGGNREASKGLFLERPSSLPAGQGASSGRAVSPDIPRKAGYSFQLSLIPQNLTGFFENFPIPRVANLRQEPGCPHLNSCRFLSLPRCPLSTVRWDVKSICRCQKLSYLLFPQNTRMGSHSFN